MPPGLRVVIEDVAAGGDGIARAPDGRVVLVRGAIPGDTVEVDVVEEKRTMLRGEVEAVLEASADRVAPPCPHVAGGCGGCGWQHVAIGAQRRFKVRIVEEALRRIGRIEAEVQLAATLPAEAFRTTVRILVEDGRAAFRAERSHDPVPVEHCLVAHPGLQELITHGRFGAAHEATLRVGAATGERLVKLAPGVDGGVELPGDVRVVGADELARGRRAWFADVVRGRRFRISADSFFQTRTDGAAALVEAVERAGGDAWGHGRLVDLYGGVGLFAGCLGQDMAVTLIESSRAAAADARHNLRDAETRVVRIDARRWRPSPADLVVADPPRSGLGRNIVPLVAETGAERVVLVSCDAASLGRDAALLQGSGYELCSSTLVDLFPHTPHVEVVSRFDRAPS